MSDDSGHNDSSILREFSSQYEELCAQNKQQAATIEALQQEVHTLRKNLQLAEKLQVEYQSELDCHQQQIENAKDLATSTVLKLKEEHSSFVKELEDKVHNLECELREVSKVQAVDKDELLKARRELKEFQDESPVGALKAQLQEIMEEHTANRVACVQHLELNQVLLKEKAYLMDELKSTRDHLEMTEEKLKICKDDMMQQSETLEDLRESLAVTQNELTCLQSGPPPDEIGRGNSLFAEVEDKRQAMVKQTKVLSKKYTEMKRDYDAKCEEISRLRRENLQLRQKWRADVEERDNRDVWLNDNYEIRIKELSKLVSDLKREEKPVFVTGNAQILSFADHLVQETKKEMVELRKEMEARSAERLNEAKALYMARSKAQTLNAEVMVLYAENVVLRDRLGQAEITDIPSPGKTLKRIKEVWERATEAPLCSCRSNIVEESQEEIISDLTESCSQPNEASDFCSLSNEEHTSCSSVDNVLEICSSPTATIEEVNNTAQDAFEEKLQSHSEELRSPSPISPNPTPITSLISNVLTPQCVVRRELIQKMQSEGMCKAEETSPTEIVTFGASPDKNSVQFQDNILVIANASECHPKTEENDQDELHNLPSHLEHIPEQVSSNVHSPATAEFKDEALPPEPVSGEVHGAATAEFEDEPSTPTFKEPSEVTNENWIEPVLGSKRPPRQSILTKPSRPSLMPVDQNLMRKVRFADPSSPPVNEDKSQANVQKSPPKKKLPRAPKTYKTKFIASVELD